MILYGFKRAYLKPWFLIVYGRVKAYFRLFTVSILYFFISKMSKKLTAALRKITEIGYQGQFDGIVQPPVRISNGLNRSSPDAVDTTSI